MGELDRELMKRRARELRNDATKQERHLWFDFLRTHPERFYRQMVVGNYIVDFVCARLKLVVELDGAQHYELEAKAYDARRTADLNERGYKVIRFLNSDVDRRFASVCGEIDKVIEEMKME